MAGLKPPGDIISEARKREARMTEDGRVDLISMRHVESMLDELMGSWGIPKAADTFYIRGWVNLQSYVNEDDQSLRSLNRAWKDKCSKAAQLTSHSFDEWYAEYRDRRELKERLGMS